MKDLIGKPEVKIWTGNKNIKICGHCRFKHHCYETDEEFCILFDKQLKRINIDKDYPDVNYDIKRLPICIKDFK